jgi:error-prone DNA polymerase
MFVELFARTNFSFLRGGSSPRALIQRAAELGYGTLGIADCDGLYGAVRALEAAEELGLRLVLGCELSIDDAPVDALWVHVASHQGYVNLCKLLTTSHGQHPKRRPRKLADGVPRNQFAGLSIEQVCEHSEGLYCTVAPRCAEHLPLLKEAFGDRLSLAAWRHHDGEDAARLQRIEAIERSYGVAVCATNRVLFAEPKDKLLHDVLHCIREGITMEQAGRALLPNAEPHLRGPADVEPLFADRPAWVLRTQALAAACTFSLRTLKYRFPHEHGETRGPPGETPDQLLRRLTYEGVPIRFVKGLPENIRLQIEKELELIAKLQVAPYFLSVKAVVEMARARDILCQGRGSAANSAVCFCLGITAVDPSRSRLLFERFLSAERREPPDIDVDFEHERREEVIQEIYARYGRDRAAMVSEVISYRGKSALREVAKVFGFSDEDADKMSALVSWWDQVHEVKDSRVVDCGLDPTDGRVRQVLAMAHAIQGFPRHLSIHVGGFVLSAEPLSNVAPVEPATMEGRTVIPWDKDDLDALGFFKVDVLGLGMLTAVRKALAMVQSDPRVQGPTAIEQLSRIPAEDPRVYDSLCAADTVGVFQIESRAQMSMLPRLRPRRFYDLVVEVAIVRPGPIQGGMVHPYLRRRSGKEPATIPHPKLGPILDRTLGVPLFQEQVMQIAIEGAGYTGGEADQLRRDMAAWRRSGKLERHRAKLLAGFEKNGISTEFGERLYQSIQGFGEYGFPESHAASFALLVYASAWLKVHHPAAFAAALINSQPMGFYSVSSIVKDAERHDVEVLPVRVDASDWDCTLEMADRSVDADPPALRLGLCVVKGLGEEVGKRIEKARRSAPFTSVDELTARANVGKREIEVLAAAGALVGFGLARREAMWKVKAPREHDLFAGVDLDVELPELPVLSHAEQLVLDYRVAGVAVRDHAMSVLRSSLPKHYKRSRDLVATRHGDRVSTAGMVICRQRPQTASGVVFLTLEDEHGFINLILWPKTFERWRHAAVSSSLIAAHGKIEKEGDVIYVVPNRLEALGFGEMPSMSRDFH